MPDEPLTPADDDVAELEARWLPLADLALDLKHKKQHRAQLEENTTEHGGSSKT